jgi:hypothetical protein
MKILMNSLRILSLRCSVLTCALVFATPSTSFEATAKKQQTHAVSLPITTMGGSLTLPRYAQAKFPANSFASTQVVTMVKSATAETALDWSTSIQILGNVHRSSYEIRTNTGAQQPTQPVVFRITVPANLMAKRPGMGQAKLFAQIFQDGGQEILDNFESFDATLSGGTLTGALPPEAFTNRRRADATYEAVLIVGILGSKPKP